MKNDNLLEEYLSDYVQKMRNGEIYEHGYPESRLIPSSHWTDCEEDFIDSVIEEVSEKIRAILESNIRSHRLDYFEEY